jgi:ABC-type multidrug transport system ATPase subunit
VSQQRVVAVDGIDLSVPSGGIFGLPEPNGPGKTTIIGICTTRSLPSSGTGGRSHFHELIRPYERPAFLTAYSAFFAIDAEDTVQ